jgi:hypothetical protein
MRNLGSLLSKTPKYAFLRRNIKGEQMALKRILALKRSGPILINRKKFTTKKLKEKFFCNLFFIRLILFFLNRGYFIGIGVPKK